MPDSDKSLAMCLCAAAVATRAACGDGPYARRVRVICTPEGVTVVAQYRLVEKPMMAKVNLPWDEAIQNPGAVAEMAQAVIDAMNEAIDHHKETNQ